MGLSPLSRRKRNRRRAVTRRRARIRAMASAGLSRPEIAAKLNVTIARASVLMRAAGVRLSRAPISPNPYKGLLRYRVLAHLARAPGPLPTIAVVLAVTGGDNALRDLHRVHSVMRCLLASNSVKKTRGTRNTVLWELTESRPPMTPDDARNLVLNGAPFGDVFELLPEADRPGFREWYLSNPDLPNLKARTRQKVPVASVPTSTGEMCKCGGFLVRTGTCLTCQSCGQSSGGCS